MRLIQTFLMHRREKDRAINNECNNYILQIDKSLKELKELFGEQTFAEPCKGLEWRNFYSPLITNVALKNVQHLKKAVHYKKLIKKQSELYQNAYTLKHQISKHNNLVAKAMIPDAYGLIAKVEGKKLDEQQMECIVKDVHNHLVVSGAGTGKTTTVIGRIKFLLNSGKCKPEDILVLSFTNASASEMKQRIRQETGYNIDASTFHKLGLNIIKKANGASPQITDINLSKFIKEQLHLHMQSESYFRLLNLYLLYNKGLQKSEFDFHSESEYEDYLKLNPPITMNKEKVKSYGEQDIANFLIQSGINYEYEPAYEVNTRTEEYRQYHPDFYLPDYNIYIEYFGINKNGEVPSYFMGSNGRTASETYQESMEWKRNLHRENNTVLIECYAYEKIEGILIEKLQKRLEEKAVVFNTMSPEELWEKINDKNEDTLDGIVELFRTILNLVKSNNYTISTVRQLNEGSNYFRSNEMILTLFEPIYNNYCSYLEEHDEIDFNDMINIAKKCVEEKKYKNPYKYVIVDEYQDMSKARFSLLRSMRNSNNYDLFCVGDDWQSIYRFAGSDIGFILNFENYWGPSEISKIETTYRFSRQLIEISSNFIMQNSAQIKKSIKGNSETIGFALGEICGYTEKYAIEFMVKKLDDLPRNSSVFFIGRYLFDVKLLSDSKLLDCQYNNDTGLIEVKYRTRYDLKMNFITAHKSKGLQADYVFIINNKKSRMGFPSQIQDAPILKLLLDNCDEYPYAEERRLFYVAMTRAKKKVYLITVDGQISEFVMELKERYDEELKKEHFECPRCGGRLLKKTSIYGEFLGCSNYKITGCTYKRNIK